MPSGGGSEGEQAKGTGSPEIISDAEKHNKAGEELFEQGHFDEAILEYDKAIRLDPRLAGAYTGRGNAYADRGRAGILVAEKHAGLYGDSGAPGAMFRVVVR